MTFSECQKHIPCVDCKDECIHAGQKSADCPYYGCPREGAENNDCENCDFINSFVEQLRTMAESWDIRTKLRSVMEQEVTDDE